MSADHIAGQSTSSLEPENTPVRPLKPCRFRLSFLLIVAVYPLITTLLYVLMPLTSTWETWHRTLVITPVMVSLIVFLVTPAIQRHFGWYLLRVPRPQR